MADNLLLENVLVGSDVEYFVRKIASGNIVSAEGHIQGTKTDPYRFNKTDPMFATQLDNVLAEGNIPPARSREEFTRNIRALRIYLDDVLRAKGLETVAVGAVRMDPTQLQTEHAKTLGCSPSLNCWTLETVPVELRDPNVRSAGFHIHVGYKNPTPEVNVLIARTMDAMLGVQSTQHEPVDEARLRRDTGYGLAGNFRHQPWGVEYRVLSSHFASSTQLISWAYYNTMYIVGWLNNIVECKQYAKLKKVMEYGDRAQGVINNPAAHGISAERSALLHVLNNVGLRYTIPEYC